MRRDVPTALLAALATLLASASLATVVENYDWLRDVLAVLVVVAASGLALRRTTSSPALVVAGQVLAGAVLVSWLFAREQAIAGLLPGPAAWQRLAALWVDGGDTIQRYTAPAPPLRGILLLVTVGVLAVAIAVDALTSSLRMAAVSGLPLLAIYCVPAAVVEGGLHWGYFVSGAIGWLILVAHDAQDRLGGWGRVLPRWTGSGPAPDSEQATLTAAAARRLGAGALVAAVVLPAVVPSLPEVGLGRSGAPGSGSGLGDLAVVNPVLALRDNLTQRRDIEVLRYTTSQRDISPLRIVTADRFDGESWSPSTTAFSRDQKAKDGLPSPPGLTSAINRRELRMRVSVKALDQDFLPLPYPTRRVDVEGDWFYDARSLNVVGDGETTRGKRYTVDYLAVTPTTAQLQQAGQAPREIRDRYTELPSNLSPDVETIARGLTRTAASQFDKALVLQQWFRDTGGFRYSTKASASGGSDAVLAFLRSKEGYCVQFSSAMAVMARTLGIPARVAVGFLPGTPVGGGTWQVKLTDAHAWPELYFQGVGWVRFEPTPSSRAGAPPSWAVGTVTATPQGAGQEADTQAGQDTQTTLGNRQKQLEEREAAQVPTPPTTSSTASADSGWTPADLPWRWIGWTALVLAALLLTPTTTWLGRRRRWSRADTDVDRAEVAWTDLQERLGDLGLSVPAGATPRQTDARIAGSADLDGEPRAALARVSRSIEDTRYAPPLQRSAASATLAADVDMVVRAVATTRSRGERARAAVLPTSGTRRLRGVLDQAATRAGRLDRAVAATSRRSLDAVTSRLRRLVRR